MADTMQTGAPTPDIAGLLSGLLGNPELLARLAPVAASLRASMEGAPTELTPDKSPSDEAAEAPKTPSEALPVSSASLTDPDTLARLAPLIAGISGASASRSPEEAQREALLRALAPFLSEARRNALETLLQLSRMGGLLGLLQLGRT